MRARLVVLSLAAVFGASAVAYAALDRQPAGAPVRTLRVCADPNNLPFSNRAEEGFENRIVELIAADLGAKLEYTWWAQRRGFVRNTLLAESCDLIPGVPEHLEPVATTAPYYRSAYVFVTRDEMNPPLESIDDPRLHRLKVGVHLIGDDYSNPPPVTALARRGIVRNVAGYSLYGDYREPNPPARLVEAAARGDVDVAIVWGPLGGYFSTRSAVPLRVRPLRESDDGVGVPFAFAIAMGLRPADSVLARRVGEVLTHRRAEIRRILERYGVPLLPDEAAEAT
jgi:mxaJ protein